MRLRRSKCPKLKWAKLQTCFYGDVFDFKCQSFYSHQADRSITGFPFLHDKLNIVYPWKIYSIWLHLPSQVKYSKNGKLPKNVKVSKCISKQKQSQIFKIHFLLFIYTCLRHHQRNFMVVMPWDFRQFVGNHIIPCRAGPQKSKNCNHFYKIYII